MHPMFGATVGRRKKSIEFYIVKYEKKRNLHTHTLTCLLSQTA